MRPRGLSSGVGSSIMEKSGSSEASVLSLDDGLTGCRTTGDSVDSRCMDRALFKKEGRPKLTGSILICAGCANNGCSDGMSEDKSFVVALCKFFDALYFFSSDAHSCSDVMTAAYSLQAFADSDATATARAKSRSRILELGPLSLLREGVRTQRYRYYVRGENAKLRVSTECLIW